MVSKTSLMLFASLLLLAFVGLASATPTGPDAVDVYSNSTWAGSTSGAMINTSGGVISAMNVTSTSQNDNWKAFVGNVIGTLTLDDSSGATIYGWTTTTTNGEVFATRTAGAINWGSIACATGPQITAEETALSHNGADGISSTFSGTTSTDYYVAGQTLANGNCAATNTYQDNATQSSFFEEFIAYDGTNIVFGTNIEDDKGDYSGGTTYDFQMLVPENASVSWNSQIPYYLYVELG